MWEGNAQRGGINFGWRVKLIDSGFCSLLRARMAVQSKLRWDSKHSVASISLLAGLYFLRTRLIDLAVEKSKKRQSPPPGVVRLADSLA